MSNATDPTETSVRGAFARLVSNEPPMGVDARAAIETSRHAARHRLAYRASAAAAVVVVAVGAFAVAARRNDTPTRNGATPPVETPKLQLTSAHGEVAATTEGRPADSALDARIIAAIKASSPSGLTFAFGGGGTDASSVDGTADDGAGPGRLYVWTEGPGMLTREPCTDPEFVAGASCTETHLAGDAILSARGLVDYQGIETYEISLTHADGSGVGAEVGNFTLPPMLKQILSARDKRDIRPNVTRPSPPYDADQIAAVVQAVDTAIHS